METKDLLDKLNKKEQIQTDGTLELSSLLEIFGDRQRTFIDELKLFGAYYKSIPNLIELGNINCEKAKTNFEQHYFNDINNILFTKNTYKKNNKLEFEELFYFLFEDLIINFDMPNSRVILLYRKTSNSVTEEIIKIISQFKVRKRSSFTKITLLVKSFNSITTESLEITKPKLSITDNYNDDFQKIHKTILKRLMQNNDKGIVLLHGKPGTGKTSYIRFLITTVKKKVIFLPPNMASTITNPDLLSVLIDNPNSIFVIEDAENIVIDRERNGASPVSALLNLSDGLLSDCLNIQIVCSFNTDLSKVDSALLRKGRLIAKYEFKELETYKAQQLSGKLGFNTTIARPTTLTDIYNQKEINFQPEKRRAIGF